MLNTGAIVMSWQLSTVESWSFRGAEFYRVMLQDTGEVLVRMPEWDGPCSVRTFTSLDRAMFTLRGIVPDECWSLETLTIWRDMITGWGVDSTASSLPRLDALEEMIAARTPPAA